MTKSITCKGGCYIFSKSKRHKNVNNRKKKKKNVKVYKRHRNVKKYMDNRYIYRREFPTD